jgi:hypothetical protein
VIHSAADTRHPSLITLSIFTSPLRLLLIHINLARFMVGSGLLDEEHQLFRVHARGFWDFDVFATVDTLQGVMTLKVINHGGRELTARNDGAAAARTL